MERASENFSLQQYLRSHDIIFQQPPEIWQEGLTVGNGDMVCVSFADPDAFCWTIDKADIYDSRVELDPARSTYYPKVLEMLEKNDQAGLARLFQETRWPVRNYPYPNAKSCGLLKVKIEDLDTLRLNRGEYEQRLRIAEGLNHISVSTPDLELNCESLVYKTENVLCIRLEGCSAAQRLLSVSFERWLDPIIGNPAFTKETLPGHFSMIHKINEKDAYVVAGAVVGFTGRMILEETSFACEGEIGPGNFALEIYLAVEKQEPGALSAKPVVELLSRTIAKGYQAILGEHIREWGKFWEKGYLWYQDKFLEQAFYVTLYYVACAAGKSMIPLTLTYPGSLHDYSGFGYYVCDSNIEMAHWPLLPANHPELMKPFYEFFHNHLDRICRETELYFGMNGASIPFSLGVDGTPIGDIWARLMLQPTGWIAELLWWCYEFTQDKALLHDKLYPFIKQAAMFYINYMTPDDHSRLSGYPSTPPEQITDEGLPLWVRNDSAGRSVIRVTLQAAAEACRILNIDADFETQCRQTLGRLADYPDDGKELLDFEGAPADLPLQHSALLNGVFSTGEINAWGDKKPYVMAKRTFENIFDHVHPCRANGYNPWKIPLWVDDIMYNWLICVAARVGEAEKAWACLHDQVFFLQLRENGTSTCHEPMFPQRLRNTHWPTSNHIAGTTTSILEMFLQSHAGVIQVFPGVPPVWNGGFSKLLARGAFEVSAYREKDEVRYIGIRSLAGLPCRVLNPWKNSTLVNVLRETIKIAEATSENEFIEFDTEPNKTYSISPAGIKVSELYTPKSSGILSSPRRYKGPQYLGKVTHDAKPQEVTIGRIYRKRVVYSLADKGSIAIPAGSYSTGNYRFAGGTHLAIDPTGNPEYGLKASIYDFTFGGPYPEFAEYWIECKKATQAEIGITYKNKGVTQEGSASKLILNSEIVTDSLFLKSVEDREEICEEKFSPLELNKGQNTLRIERHAHLPLLCQLQILAL